MRTLVVTSAIDSTAPSASSAAGSKDDASLTPPASQVADASATTEAASSQKTDAAPASSTPSKSADDQTNARPVIEVLRELLQAQRVDEALKIVEKLLSRNIELEKKVVELSSPKHRSEVVSRAQLDFFLKNLTQRPAPTNEARKAADEKLLEKAEHTKQVKQKKEPHSPPRRTPPADMPRVENLIRVPDDELPCPNCSAVRTCVKHLHTEVFDYIPAKVIVRVDVREVVACLRCEEGAASVAPVADKVVESGYYGSALVAQLVVGKYRDSLPLYRQAEQLQRLGLDMPSSSMADQIEWATDLLRPIYRHMLDCVLYSDVMQLDGTGMPTLENGRGRVRLGTLWGYAGDDDVAAYIYTKSGKKRGQSFGEIGPEDMLEKRRGPVVADASNLFDRSFNRCKDLIEVGCNMHGRRYFKKALDGGDARAAIPLAAFKKLYKIEGEIRELPPDAKASARQSRSKPVYDELIAWCDVYQPGEPPKSLLGRAIRYLLNHKVALTRFIDDGALPIDNGHVERLHRRVATGRRNYLFVGSDEGGVRAAIAYSILATCALASVDPAAYLSDVLPRLNRDGVTAAIVPELMPAEWKKTHPEAILRAYVSPALTTFRD